MTNIEKIKVEIERRKAEYKSQDELVGYEQLLSFIDELPQKETIKLINVSEAAERLGVSRQTLSNWCKSGIIRIRKTGKTGNANWVDADTIEALGDTMQDVARAKEMLENERTSIVQAYRKESEILHEIRNQMRLVNTLGVTPFIKEFFATIPQMLNELGIINARENNIMQSLIYGHDIGWLADEYGLTRYRIAQIFYIGCRKAKKLACIKEQLSELEKLKVELADMKQAMQVMSLDLKIQQETERNLKEMEDSERIEFIEKTDELLKMFRTRLVNFDLSVRALNCLKSADIETVGDLVKCQQTDLLRFRNFGKKSLIELRDFLNDHGLSFGMDVDKIYRDRIAQRLQVLSN